MTLDEEIKAFYMALGKAITQWQRVEEMMAMIFSSSTDHDKERSFVANAAFHAVLNFKTKLGMVDSALAAIAWASTSNRKAGEPSPLYEAWTPLRNRAERKAKRRNEFAHFAMHIDPKARPGARVWLAPNTIDVNALLTHEGKPPRRSTKEIIAHGESFQTLGVDLMKFFSDFHGLNEGPPSASVERWRDRL